MDESSQYYQDSWPSRGPAQHPGAFSPDTSIGPVNATPPGAPTADHLDLEDASFAESYRADASPLSNPLFNPRAAVAVGASPLGLSWPWQRDSTAQESGHDAIQSAVSHEEPQPASDPPAAASADEQQLAREEAGGMSGDRAAEQLAAAEPSAVEAEAREPNASEWAPVEEGPPLTRGSGPEDAPRAVIPSPSPQPEDEDMSSAPAHASQQPRVGPTIIRLPQLESEEGLDDTTCEPEVAEVMDQTLASSPDRLTTTQQGDAFLLPPPSVQRRRRSANDLLNAAAEAFIQKDYEDRRRRRASAPLTKALPQAAVAKRGQKPTPAKTDTTTPKKRGRPRKSQGAVTPATGTNSVVSGRPKRAVATPVTKAGVRKPATSARTRRVAIADKKPTRKATQAPVKAATPKSGRRPRQAATAAPAEDTPKRRGRPPKSATAAAPPPLTTKSGRVVRQPVVPSPTKRGRSARNAAPVAKAPKRGRAAASKTGTATAPAPVKAPKRLGRPPKNATQAAAPKPAAKSEAKALVKKRGRGSGITEDMFLELPPPTRKRRRAVNATAEPAAPVAKKRGRASHSEPEADTSEPAAKRRRTTRQAAEDVKPVEPSRTSRRGRQGVKADTAAVTEEPPKSTRGRSKKAAVPKPVVQEVEKPKGRGRGRQAAAKAGAAPGEPVEPVDEQPMPARRGRAAKADARGSLAKAAMPKGVAKKSTRGAKKAQLTTQRSLRSRG